jgi:hypothetical protein
MNPTPLNWTARRIARLAHALDARRYLEIGVSAGDTFRGIDIADRTGVDPKFMFPIAQYADLNTHFHETTSDAFFETLPIDTTFDIYFIDGLHTFEQTLRDFCNAVTHSHPRTVWLLDDTEPCDVYSTDPVASRALFFRHRTGDLSVAWHGDVFKLVYYIHDFMPKLNYRTLVGDNPQTLVWRSSSDRRSPRFNSLETISRMTYFDMTDHIDILRQCSENDGIGLCLAEMTQVGAR